MIRPLFTLRAAIRTALAEAGEKGATLEELETATGAERREIQRALGALGEAGEKFAAPITSKLWRHFATEAHRDAWLRRAKPMPTAKPAKVGKPGAEQVVKGGTISPPPPRMPKPAAEPIRTSATRVTVAPTPAPRFAPEPGHVGEFSQAGIGRDVDTGKSWEARA